MEEVLIPPNSPGATEQKIAPPAPKAEVSKEPAAEPETDSLQLSSKSMEMLKDHVAAEKTPAEEVESDLEERAEKERTTLTADTNKALEPYNRKISFVVNDDTGELQVQVIDTDSNEILKTIPSDDVLKMREKFSDLIGLFLDEVG